MSKINSTVLAILKFVGAVVLFPAVWAMSVNFHKYVNDFPGTQEEFFFWGMFGYLLCFLFFYQFWGVYEMGQKITAQIFQFMAPANNFMARIIPLFLTVILLLMMLTKNFFNVDDFDHYFMFFAGFTFTMHLLLTAQEYQNFEPMFIKPTYLLMIMIVTIFLISAVILLFDLVSGKFSYWLFIKTVAGDTAGIYYALGEKLTFLK